MTTYWCHIISAGFFIIAAYIILTPMQHAKENKWGKQRSLAQQLNHSIDIDESEATQLRRQLRVKKVCNNFPNMPHPSFQTLSGSLEIKEGEKLAMCKLAKVGTTTFAVFFNAIGETEGIPEYLKIPNGQKRNTIKDTMGFNIEELLQSIERNHIFTFVFVRHPFDRLASAYEDIFKKTKGKYKDIADKSFGAYVNYLLIELEKRGCHAGLQHCERLDVHYRPFYFRCDFCQMKYNFIGKLETFETDMLLLLNRTHLMNRMPLSQTLSLKLNQPKHSIDNRTATYFAMISKEQKLQLYEIYKIDFLLFGYSPDEYL